MKLGIDFKNPFNLVLATLLPMISAVGMILVDRVREQVPIVDMEIFFLITLLAFYGFYGYLRADFNHNTKPLEKLTREELITAIQKVR